MIKSRLFLSLVFFFGVAFQVLPQSSSQNAAVLLSATVQSSPASITVQWAASSNTSSISIYRKLKTETSWGGAIANPSSSSTQHQDNSVQVGVAYEYKVVRSANGATGTGYIATGIEVALPDYRGKLILLVDNTLAPQMVSELAQLQKDLKGDGWAVIREDVSRTAPASSIRSIVMGHYNSDPSNVKAVYVVGHVPVPYSGNAAADGHSEHVGAWPCDGYYGEMTGSWTDNSVNNNGAARQANRNVPGDGKFDHSNFPSDLELQVGRVDMYDMPAFSQGEVQLLKNYLNRAHSFKIKGWSPLVRGLMFDNLQWVSNPIAGSGWRSMGPLVGASNITNANQNGTSFHNLVNGESYMWTYSSAGGLMTWEDGGYTYNGASNVGTTQNYASNNSMGGVFNMSCGSYFGDWDNKNNFLRAPIAKGDALTSVWAGIPAWYFHHMGLGDNIGYSTLATMNNSGMYTPLTEGWQGSIGRTHLGLMGDPSLRMEMIAPPTSLTVSNANGVASFNWNASPESNILGYHIYKFSSTGTITRLTSSPVTGTSHQSSSIPFEAGREYMVRAVKLKVNYSGSYLNQSLGALATAAGSASADCNGVVGGGAVSGSSCNDNDPCTINDTWNSSCQCVGTPVTVSASITPAGSTSFCSGGSVVLDANTGSGLSYQWRRDGSSISGANSSSYTATEAGAYTVRVNNGSCESTSSGVTITITSGPSASITPGGSTNFCSGGSVQLNANSGSGYNYQWRLNGSSISGANSVNYTATEAGDYTVRITNGGCETTSSSVNVTVNSVPSASITAEGSTSFCSGGSVVLNANSGSGLNYQWRRDGSSISGANSGSYTATEAGVYTVRVSNGGCETTSSGTTVSVGSGPSASITPAGPTSFCSGGNVLLQGNSGNGYSYQWRRDGSSISGANSVNYTATEAGVYTLRVTDGGCQTTSSSVTVSISSTPSAQVTPAGSTTFCAGGSVVLNANTGSGLSYQWRRDGSSISGANSASYTATEAGSYTVRISSNGCETTSASVTVSISSAPSASITSSGGTDFCSGGSVVLNANIGSGLTYVWRRDGSVISGATSSSYTASISGDYTVIVTNGGCSATSSVLEVNVTNGPVANITPQGATNFCEGGSVVLSATSGTGLSYAWQRNGQNIVGANAASFTATQNGSYTVIVSGNGCNATSSPVAVTTFVPDAPVLSLSGPNELCTGDFLDIFTDEIDGASYAWSLNGSPIGTSDQALITVSEPGSYALHVVANGCVSESSETVITLVELPLIEISATGPTNVCVGDTVDLIATYDPSYSYVWIFNGQQMGNANDTIFSATTPGQYTVFVSNEQCSNVATPIMVNMSPDVAVFTSGSTSICEGDSVSITAVADSSYSYTWSLDGVVLEDETTATINAGVSGSYMVTIENAACSASSQPVDVVVSEVPVAAISAAGPLTFCAGDNVELSTNTNEDWSYQWMLDGENIAGATAASFIAQLTGAYTVAVTNVGCTILSDQIDVITLPIVSLELDGPAAFCMGDSVTINALVDTSYSYTWSFNGDIIEGSNANSLTADAAGEYQVSITDGSCTAASEMIVVTTSEEPTFELETVGATSFCAGDSVLLTVVPADGAAYDITWSLDDVSIEDAINDSLYASVAGMYSATVSNNGCAVTSSQEMVTTLPVVSISLQGDASFCEGGNVVLYTVFDSAYTYQWMLDGEVLNDDTSHELLVNSSGTYSVQVEGAGCTVISDSIALEVTSAPELNCFANAAEGVVGVEVLNGSGHYTYMWNGDASLDSTVLAVDGPGTHTVSVTDENGCTESCTVQIGMETEDSCIGLRTETQQTWATSTLLANGFDAAFPNDLTIGCGFRMLTLTSAEAVAEFLPSQGPSQRLPFGTLVDPGNTYGNSLAGELIALKLAVRFDEMNASFSSSPTLLQDAVVASGTFEGLTVAEVIEQADLKIGGCFSWFSRNQLRIAIASINTGYAGGTITNGFLNCTELGEMPEPVEAEQLDDAVKQEATAYPNPFNEYTTITLPRAEEMEQVTIDILSADGVVLERVFDGTIQPGTETRVEWHASTRAKGVYFYRVSSKESAYTGRVVLQ